ncbi:hypothetical protein Taro_004291 [Colocasia esculenta]|uniref:Uncharacterized protein n=1 Tax=Colocasia esculenta TaxID=4460 RepID=A0A843TP47_COLES|nr:hypothetical protein [Colocasia esculenta]
MTYTHSLTLEYFNFCRESESPSMSYHSLDGHRAVFSVHPPTSLAHSCPYLAYLYPLQPSSSSSSQVSSATIIGDPVSHHDLTNQHEPINIQTSHPFPTVDIHYHRRETHLPPYSHLNSRINGGEQASAPSATMRTIRHDSDGHLRPASFMHPFVIRHGLVSGANTSVDTPVPPYIGNPHMQGRVQDLHGPYQQQGAVGMSAPTVSSSRRSGGMRNLASRTPAASDHSALYLFPSTSSSGQSPQDAETTGVNHFYAWERDQFTPFPLMPVERGSTWWGPLQQPPRPSDTGSQTGLWHQHSSDRSSQGLSEGFSHQPLHPPHMYPFI